MARPPDDAAAYSKRTANGRPYDEAEKPMDRRGCYQPPAAVNVKKQSSVRRIRTCLRIRLTLLFMIVLLPGGRKGRPCEGDFSSKNLKPKTYSLKPYSVYTRGTRLETAQSSS